MKYLLLLICLYGCGPFSTSCPNKPRVITGKYHMDAFGHQFPDTLCEYYYTDGCYSYHNFTDKDYKFNIGDTIK